MSTLDWLVVALFLATVMAVGLMLSKRASGSVEDYFVSGRNLPWWLAGTSILATSFASDTPLHVTRVIREGGLGAAWFYWNGVLSGLLVAFFFARMWRRAGIVTDAEMIELRYSGRPARALRVTMATFRAVVLELITLSWVILGMAKVVRTVLGLPATLSLLGFTIGSDLAIVVVLVSIALAYSVTSGLWGVVVTDMFEFVVALGGAILLAVLAVDRAGGVQQIRETVTRGPLGPGALDFLPTPSAVQLPAVALVVFTCVMWWANGEIDGSGKRAQRFLACRNEGHALASGLWNMVVQWVIRNWPWYLTALASLVLYPAATDHEAIYPRMMADLLPTGLKGLTVASFLAAFLSTVDSHLNLSASYLVNDVYRRFVAPDRSATHYVKTSRLLVAALAVLATTLALAIPSVLGAFRFKMELMAGLGAVYVLRWFWWRISAWTEIAALLSGLTVSLVLNVGNLLEGQSGSEAFAWRMLLIVGCSTTVAMITTLIAPPEPLEHLRAFYRRVRPPALLWGPVAEGNVTGDALGGTAVQYLLGIITTFSAMFAVGKLLLGEPRAALGLGAIACACAWVLLRWLLRAPRGVAAS